MNIDNAVVKQFEGMNLRQLAEAPVQALQGISAKDADLLNQAFNVVTIRDLAKVRFFDWAKSITTLADKEVSSTPIAK